VEDGKTLQEQKVIAGAKLLLVKAKIEEEQAQREKIAAEFHLQNVIEGATMMADVVEPENDHDDYYFELVNQQGVPIKLDPADRKNLTLAMTLQEQGQKLMDRENPDLHACLKLFTESDAAFGRVVDTHYLNCVDNYAKLCLDIMWAYLKLEAFDQIISNEWRLSRAEDILSKTYGDKNSRLSLWRDGSCAELVIYVRLHLLQAICAHRSNLPKKAAALLCMARDRLQQMTVSDQEIESLLYLGFDEREARVGLRAMNKNPEAAIQWIYQRRERIEENKKQEKAKREQKRKQRRFGKTSGGHWVNMPLLDALVTKMGFEEEMTAEALKQTDNDQEQAVNLLTTQPELLHVALRKNRPYEPSDGEINELALIGPNWSRVLISMALRRFKGDMEASLEWLLARGEAPEEPMALEASLDASTGSTGSSEPSAAPSPLLTSESDLAEDDEEESGDTDMKEEDPVPKTQAELERERVANIKREAQNALLMTGVGTGDDVSHLDVDLTEETEFLTKINSMLNVW